MYTNNYIHDKQQTNDSLFQDTNAERLSTLPLNTTNDSNVSITNNSLAKALNSVNLSATQTTPNNKTSGSHLHSLSNSRPSNIRMRRDKSNLINNPSTINNAQYMRTKSPIPRAKSNNSDMENPEYSFPALSIIYQNKDDDNAETSEKCYELIKFISTIHDKSEAKLNNYWEINPAFNNTLYYNNEIVNKGLDHLSAKFILENRVRIDLSKISYLLKIDKNKPLKDWHKLLFIDKLPQQFENQINDKEKFLSNKIGSGACGDVLKLQVQEKIINEKENKSRCAWPDVGVPVAVKRFLPRALNQNVRSFYEKVIIEYETMKLVYYASKKFNLNKHFSEVYGLFVDDIDGSNKPLSPVSSNDECCQPTSGNLNYTPYNPHEDVKIYQVSLNKFPQFSMITEYTPCDLITILPSLSDHKKQCIFKQLCVVVYHLHYNLNMIHRDIKLDNILLTPDGVIKLIDFGNANLLSTSSDLVKGILGSDAYLAPEVLLSPHSYNGKPVDVWACAIVFISLWLNKFPWKIGHTDDVGFALFSQEANSGSVSISKYGKDRLEYTTDNYNSWLGDDYGMSTVKSNNSNGLGNNYLVKKSLDDDYGTWLGDDYGQNNNNVQVIDEVNDFHHENDPFGLIVIDDAVRGKNFLLKQLPANVRPIIEKMLILDTLERHNMREVINMEEFKLVECGLGY